MAPVSRPWQGRIAFADACDVQPIARLLREMDTYYRPGAPLPDAAIYHAMIERTLEQQEGTRFVLAWQADGTSVGLACVAIVRPGRDLQGLIFLKDLFVSDRVRGQGIGTKLMAFLSAFAVSNHIGRIDLTTDGTNTGAQRLYEALGATRQEKVSYSFPADVMRRLAGDMPHR